MGKQSKPGKKEETKTAVSFGKNSKFRVENKARESEERKDDLKKRIELKRLRTAIDKLKDHLRGSIVVEQKIDPLYDLRGAARPAREFYQDPNAPVIPPPVNYFEKNEGRLWELEQGQELLKTMMELAESSVSLLGRTLDAIAIWQEMLGYDRNDTLGARHPLMRHYCQRRDHRSASELASRFLSDNSAIFAYSRLLGALRGKKGSVEDKGIDQCKLPLGKALEANQFLVFVLAYGSTFSEVLEHLDGLENEHSKELVLPGSVEEAFVCFQALQSMWKETEGAVKWLKERAQDARMPVLPVLPEVSTNAGDVSTWTVSEWHAVYIDQFRTGMEMALE